MRVLVTLYRNAPDANGAPGEWGPWEPFSLSGTGNTDHPGEQPGTDEPERCGGRKLGVWWQQQRRVWFAMEET